MSDRRGYDGRRSPPDYRSRAVRFRLFVLVCMVMVVIVAMERVSDPQFWSFMGFDQDSQKPAAEEKPGEKVDSRVRELPKSQANSVGDAFQLLDEKTRLLDQPKTIEEGGEFRFTQQDGWQYVHADLEEGQRLLLHKVLRNTRDQKELSGADLEVWNELLPRLDVLWQQFHFENKRAVSQSADTPEDEKQIWGETLARSELHWSDRVKPTLVLAAAGQPLDKNQRDLIDETQRFVDAVELQRVQDNTHLSRIREKNAWFRLFDQLKTLTSEQLENSDATRVGFLQLFRQPKQYRGKLVTIRGTARLAYHVQAPSNLYGIKGYYVFWVEPRGMSDQLINVYALETPAGFPEIKDKDLDGVKTKLFEPVEFTGYFFKNYNYRTKSGSNVAPLVLAKSPTWEAPPDKSIELPQTSYLVLGIALIALLAVGLSVFAYARSRATSPIVAGYGVSARARPQRLKELEKENVTADIGEKLRQLAESQPSDD